MSVVQDDRPAAAEFFAPRWMRLTMPLGVICGAFNVALALYELASGDARALTWLNLVNGLWLAGYFGWLSFRVLGYPIVRVTSDEIVLRPFGGRTPARLPRGQLSALRWQDSFDLRLRTRSGEEHSIRLSQISKSDRGRLVELLTAAASSPSGLPVSPRRQA